MSVGFTTLLSVDVALTLLHVCTVQDSLRLYSGNIMCRQLFASTWVDVVLLVLWYIDGISAFFISFSILVHKVLTSRNSQATESLHGEDLEGTGVAADACGGVRLIYHRCMRLVLSRQSLSFGFVSYEVLRYPFSLWSEAEAMSRRVSDSFFSFLQNVILEDHLMQILRRMGMSCHIPDPTMVFS